MWPVLRVRFGTAVSETMQLKEHGLGQGWRKAVHLFGALLRRRTLREFAVRFECASTVRVLVIWRAKVCEVLEAPKV